MSNSLLVKEQNACCYLSLNRYQKKNALDLNLINELIKQLDRVIENQFRVLVITGMGEMFCAGADLQEMAKMASVDASENYTQAMQLALLLDKLDNLPVFTIARVNGSSFGGGLGLLCCCDMVIADSSAYFSFSELKLGLVPATIMPYVLKTISLRQARRYILNTELFDAQQALQIGLVHQVVESDNLDHLVDKQLNLISKTKPQAFALAKQLMLKNDQLTEQQIRVSAHQLAKIRTQDEAIKGINAFINKTND